MGFGSAEVLVVLVPGAGYFVLLEGQQRRVMFLPPGDIEAGHVVVMGECSVIWKMPCISYIREMELRGVRCYCWADGRDEHTTSMIRR